MLRPAHVMLMTPRGLVHPSPLLITIIRGKSTYFIEPWGLKEPRKDINTWKLMYRLSFEKVLFLEYNKEIMIHQIYSGCHDNTRCKNFKDVFITNYHYTFLSFFIDSV